MPRPTTLERAFELAGARVCASIDELRAQLRSEGYGDAEDHLSFPSVRRQLQDIIYQRPAPAKKLHRRTRRADAKAGAPKRRRRRPHAEMGLLAVREDTPS